MENKFNYENEIASDIMQYCFIHFDNVENDYDGIYYNFKSFINEIRFELRWDKDVVGFDEETGEWGYCASVEKAKANIDSNPELVNKSIEFYIDEIREYTEDSDIPDEITNLKKDYKRLDVVVRQYIISCTDIVEKTFIQYIKDNHKMLNTDISKF